MNLYLLLLSACVFWGTCAADNSPMIRTVSPDIVADKGDTVELTCTIDNRQDYPLTWIRKQSATREQQIMAMGTSQIVPNPRAQADFNSTTGIYSLTLSDLNANDIGVYQCQLVVSVDEMYTSDVKLNLNLAPNIDVGEEGKDDVVRVMAGKPVEFACKADGFPKPEITWTREDMQVLPSGEAEVAGSKVNIPVARMEDRGQYICLARNDHGEARHTFSLEVTFAPTIEVPRPRVPQAEGYDVELECHLMASPPPAIFWKMGDRVLDNTGNVQISYFAAQGHVTKTKLKITEIREDQFGEYSCQASNRYGSATEHMELYQSKMPICPPICGDFDLTNGSPASKISTMTIGTIFISMCVTIALAAH